MRKRINLVLVLMLSVLMLGCGTMASFAATNVRETDVQVSTGGTTLVLYKGEFRTASKTAILNKINTYRRQACENGYPDPRNTSRKLTRNDYVPIKWSSDLEWLAQTRAAEASLNMTHDRPNGGRYNSLTHNGVYSQAEVLAWNNETDLIIHGIEQWYGERSNWVNQKSGTVTGHYKQMINPANIYIGIGGFKPPSGYGTVAGEFRNKGELSEAQIGVSGSYLQKVEVANSNLVVTTTMPRWLHVGRSQKAGFTYKAKFVKNGKTLLSSVTPASLTWRSSDDEIAYVDASGYITGNMQGDVTITANISGIDHNYALGVREHLWNGAYTTDVPATAVRDGVRSIRCSVCGTKKSGSEASIPKFVMPKTSISKLTKGRKSFTVKWKKRTGITGYRIQYSTSKSFKNAKTITISKAGTGSKTKKKLKARKKYYVRIQTYKVLYGHTYYSDWSKRKYVKTK